MKLFTTILYFVFLSNVFGQNVQLVIPVSIDQIEEKQYSENGKYLLTNKSFNSEIFTLWDLRSSRQLKQWHGDKAGFTAVETEIWLIKDDTLMVLDIKSDSVIAQIHLTQFGNPFFLNSKRQALINNSNDNSIFLWDYSLKEIVGHWQLKQPSIMTISSSDDFFLVHSNDSLFLRKLNKSNRIDENSWRVENMRKIELNRSNDYMVVTYTDTNAFEGLSDDKSVALAEFIDLRTGVIQNYRAYGVSQFDEIEFNHDETEILLETRWFGSYLFDVASGKMLNNFPGALSSGNDSGDYSTKFIEDKNKIAYWKEKEGIIEIWGLKPLKKESEVLLSGGDRKSNIILQNYGFIAENDSLILRGNSIKASHIFLNSTGSICLMGGGHDNSNFNNGYMYPYFLWNQIEGKVIFSFETQNDIISAFFLNNDSQLLIITDNQIAILWDIVKGEKLKSFNLFESEPLFCSIDGGTNFRVDIKGEGYYESYLNSYETYDSLKIKTEYKSNGKNILMLHTDLYTINEVNYSNSDNAGKWTQKYFNHAKSFVILFDIFSGENIQKIENKGMQIGPVGFSNNDQYILLKTKQTFNEMCISLFKGSDLPEELQYTKIETFKEYIQKENLLETLSEEFGNIEFSEKNEILSFFEKFNIDIDDILSSTEFWFHHESCQIFPGSLPSWVISEVDVKNNIINFYLVSEGWSSNKKILLKRLDFLDFLDNNYSKELFNVVSDQISNDQISDRKEISEFIKRHDIDVKKLINDSSQDYLLFIRPFYRKNFTENLWNVKSGNWEDQILSNYYLHDDTVSPGFKYKQDEDKIMIWNKAQPKDSLNLFLFDKEPLILLPSGYYMASKNATKKLHYVTEDIKVISFEQLDIRYNRPDIVLKAMGNRDTILIDSYRKAYEKRTRHLGIDTTLFSNDYSVPESEFVNGDKIPFELNNEYLLVRMRGWDSAFFLDRFNIYINEIPLFGERGFSLVNRKTHYFDTTINIQLSQGENRIETSFFNVNATESYRMPLTVDYISKKPVLEKTHFIGIGIDKFKEEGHDLSYSVKDVRDLAKALKTKLGDQLTIDTLFNQNVNVSNVQALKKRLLQTNINDKVIISYSGHGLLNEEYDYFLSAYNVEFLHPENGGIPYEVLEDLLDSIPARKKLLLIDACHSGEVDKDDFREMAAVAGAKGLVQPKGAGATNTSSSNTVGLQNSFQLMQELFVNVQKGSGATIISAAAGDQFALEGGKLENGFFTYAILKYMKEQEDASVNSLKKYVYTEVEKLSGGLQKPTSRIENLELDWKVW